MAQRLTGEQRAFLQLVAAAAFSNPFGRERDELDHRIAGLKPRVPNDRLMAAVKERLHEALRQLGGGALPRLDGYGEADRALLKAALLFHHFHRYEQKLDELIQLQIQAGDAPVTVEFADALWEDLAAMGLGEAEVTRNFAIFYQLRRAYYFIGRSLAGASASMVDLRRHLWNNAFTFQPAWYEHVLCEHMEDFSTLLLGETGTGKGQVAAAIGRSNFIPYDRRKKAFKESFTLAFLAINLSQYPPALIESELFGHKKGAFTGAIENHAGVFARCSPHGAIFIDEVGDVDVPTQVKLLRVLQERAFSPVGGHETLRFAGRVIAATNKDVDQLRRTGQFRDDFYYRLCSDVIALPPLRQRLQEDPDELTTLVAHVLRSWLGEDGAALVPQIRELVDRSLPRDYAWPGNVRELEQCVRRILLTGVYAGDPRREREDAARGPADGGAPTAAGTGAAGFKTAQEVVSEHCRRLYAQLGTYEDVARVAGLDRRTVKKYITT